MIIVLNFIGKLMFALLITSFVLSGADKAFGMLEQLKIVVDERNNMYAELLDEL